jgi:hypothetical protein
MKEILSRMLKFNPNKRPSLDKLLLLVNIFNQFTIIIHYIYTTILI